MRYLLAITLAAFLSVCVYAQPANPPQQDQTLQKPAELSENEWKSGGQMYFIGRLFLDKDPSVPEIENLIFQTRIGFKILLRGGAEDDLKLKLAELGDKEINLCLYFFGQRVTLNKYSYSYNAKNDLEKIRKETLDLDAWAIPLFIYKVYEPLKMTGPVYASSALTPADEEFTRLNGQKQSLVTGKINGTVRSTNLRPSISSLASIEVTVDKPESVKTQVIGLFVPPDCKVTRRASNGKNIQVVAEAIKARDKIEVWYEVSGLKKIARAIIINE